MPSEPDVVSENMAHVLPTHLVWAPTNESPIDPDLPGCGDPRCACPSENELRDLLRRT